MEPLVDEPGYFEKPMFGAQACYLHGRLMLVLAARDEPWRGLLVPSEWEHHESLKEEFPPASEHPILGKWLYIPETDPEFEETATAIAELALRDDPRLGVSPKERAPGKKKKRSKR